ncbi:unnamed protein product [Clonostachys rosea]|uniref:WW domain-containing protein n=1 Tax=Bionectria ochroleuca TaxID=29856 RepID=A0ABY6UJK2_BIOOC|nr:unnamed protein product [Clonostachys rosea]
MQWQNRALVVLNLVIKPTTYLDWRNKTNQWWCLYTSLCLANLLLIRMSLIGYDALSTATVSLHIAVTLLCVPLILVTFLSRELISIPRYQKVLIHLVGAVAIAVLAVYCWARVIIETDHARPRVAYFFMTVLPPPLSIAVSCAFYSRNKAQAMAALDIKIDDIVVSDHTSPRSTDADGELGTLYMQQLQGVSTCSTEDETSVMRGRAGQDWPPPYRWDATEWHSCDATELPKGWTMEQDSNGVRIFRHESDPGKYFWRDPRRCTGWTSDRDADGREYYIDHNNRCTTWDKPTPPDILREANEGRRNYHRVWEKIWVNQLRDHLQVSHRTGVTYWSAIDRMDPRSRARGVLPPGWQRVKGQTGSPDRFFCHNSSTFSSLDPWVSLTHPWPARWYRQRWFKDVHTSEAQYTYFQMNNTQRSNKDPRIEEMEQLGDDEPKNTGGEEKWEHTARLSWGNVQSAEGLRIYTPYLAIMGIIQTSFSIAVTARLSTHVTGVGWLLYTPWVVTFTVVAQLVIMEWSFLDRPLISFNILFLSGLVDTLAWMACLSVNAVALAKGLPNCDQQDDTCKLSASDLSLAKSCQVGAVSVSALALPASLFGAYLSVVLVPYRRMRWWWEDAWWDVQDWVLSILPRRANNSPGDQPEHDTEESDYEAPAESAADNTYLMETYR